MLITRTSILDYQEYTMEMPITSSLLVAGDCLRDGGASEREAYPALNENQIYFLQTGITPDAMKKETGR